MSEFEMIRRKGKVLMQSAIHHQIRTTEMEDDCQSKQLRGVLKNTGNNYNNEDEHTDSTKAVSCCTYTYLITLLEIVRMAFCIHR